MENRIYIKELLCYQKKGKVSEKRIRIMEQHFYNLELLTMKGQQKEMEAFIRSRGEELSMATVDADITYYNVIAKFMKDKYPLLDSFRAVPEEVFIKRFKAWLLKHGYHILSTYVFCFSSWSRKINGQSGKKTYGIWKIWDLMLGRIQ